VWEAAEDQENKARMAETKQKRTEERKDVERTKERV